MHTDFPLTEDVSDLNQTTDTWDDAGRNQTNELFEGRVLSRDTYLTRYHVTVSTTNEFILTIFLYNVLYYKRRFLEFCKT